ncbi:MAG: hypothetical protein GX606_05605, partial [Elusimicrobia bacterium]|nr:hypothetical protein [Elusimicrobiota bacterium]
LFWMILSAFRKDPVERLKHFFVVLSLVFLIQAPFFLRNLSFRQEPVSRVQALGVMVERPGLDTLIANFVRNMATHMSVGIQEVNDKGIAFLGQGFQKMGLDLNPSRSGFGNYKFTLPKTSTSDDTATNPLHFFLILLLSVALSWPRRFSADLKKYWVCLLFMMIVLSWYVRWQPWIARFHLPFFVLSAAWMAVTLDRVRSVRWKALVAVLFLVMAIPFLTHGFPRRMMGRKSMLRSPRIARHYMYDHSAYLIAKAVVDMVRSSPCRDIGLIISNDGWESPWWALLNAAKEGYRIEHVLVSNGLEKAPYPLGPFAPCLVIVDPDRIADEEGMRGQGFAKVRTVTFGPRAVSLYMDPRMFVGQGRP